MSSLPFNSIVPQTNLEYVRFGLRFEDPISLLPSKHVGGDGDDSDGSSSEEESEFAATLRRQRDAANASANAKYASRKRSGRRSPAEQAIEAVLMDDDSPSKGTADEDSLTSRSRAVDKPAASDGTSTTNTNFFNTQGTDVPDPDGVVRTQREIMGVRAELEKAMYGAR